MDDLTKNPFEDVDMEAPGAGEAELRPGPAPSLWESFKENLRSKTPFLRQSDAFENAARQLMDERIVKKVARMGVAQPGDSPLLGKPSQQEYDEARFRLAEAKRQKERDEAFNSPTILGKAAGLAGGLLGTIASPTNIITAGGLVAKGGTALLARLGATGAGGRIAGVGLEAGAVNAALDIPTQAMRIGAGIEDNYDPARTALAFGAGQVLGSGMAGVAHIVQGRRALTMAEQARVDEYIVSRNRELAQGDGVVPGADAGKVQPEVLARITEAAKVAEPVEGGLVRLEISPQERDALRTAGYPVADDNTVPQSVIADLARREATQPVEVTARGDAPAATETPATARPNEAVTSPDRMGTPEQGAGEAGPAGAGVRPAGDAGQPGAGGTATQAGQPLPLGGRLGTVQPEGRLAQQPEIGRQQLSAPQAISIEPIRRDLGLDIPGTLIESPDGIKAFHGTPYDFDKFSLDKIGTGEGSQAFGHGLYFAESRKIGEEYRNRLSDGVYRVGDRLFDPDKELYHTMVKSLVVRRGIEAGIERAKLELTGRVNEQDAVGLRSDLSLLESLATQPAQEIKGNLYEVRIAAAPDRFLDWDKPLSEQSPFIQNALRKLGVDTADGLRGPQRGEDFYKQIGIKENSHSDLRANEKMREAGIEGIRYLDGSSRAKGEGSRNYVVFDDNKIQIVSKNGVPLRKPIPIADYLRGEATARQYPIMTAPAVLKAREIVQAALDMPDSVKAFDGKVQKPAVKGAPVGVFMFDATKLRTDAQRFQYKDNGDAEGVTNALKSVTKWDAAKAGVLMVWQDKAGRLFVADGHQRSGLARRLVTQGNEKSITLPGILYREADGITPEYMRAIAAATNISQGSGSPVDGAKVLRSHPELLDGSMPITRTESRQAFDLARLDDEAFRMVINEVVPYQQAAIVGRLIPNDGPRQVAAMKAIARFEPRNETEAATLIQRVSQSEIAKSEGETGNLFGDMMGAESTAGEEMRIVARAVAELKKDKNLLSRVVANADRIEQAGSQIDRGSARSVADDAEVFAKVITSNAYSAGPVRSELVRLAKEVQSGTKTVNDASREILAAVRAEAEGSIRAGAGDSGNARGAGTEAGTDEGQAGLFGNAPQALNPQAKRSGPPLNPDADARFPQRPQLQGEGGTRTLPANATPEEVASFRITEQHRLIAERLGKKLEVDGRFTIKGGVLGEYKPKEGVLRIRFDGDTSVFNHELGHAIDQRLRTNRETMPDMIAAIARNDAELRALDANGSNDPAEGVAEFIRMYLDQPNYARKQAPNFADEFDMILAKDPEMKAIMDDAYRATQIDSGMDPMQRMASMIAPAEEPTGLRRFNEERKRYGIPSTLALNFDRFYANIVGKDRYVDRMVRLLNDAHFEKTGKPLPRQFREDPYKMFRMLPGAKQAAVDAIYNGVRDYGKAIEGPKSASLRDALSIAFEGNLARMDNIDDVVVKDFNGYLVARRSRNLYSRWESGDLRNPPVRASKNEVLQSIADFEARYPQFVEAADKVFSFANAIWRKKFEAGLITKDVFDAVSAKGREYVPFFRDMQDDVSRGTGGGGGAGQERSVVKTIKGSSRDILDPIRSLMYDAAQSERIIAVNDTFRSVVKLAESGGEFAGRFVERIPNNQLKAVTIDMAEAMKNAAKQAGLDPASADGIIRSMESLVGDDLSATVFRSSEITPSGERIFFVWENGERVAYKVGNDPFSKNFFETVSSMNAVERDIMLAMFGKANAMFSQFITNAPQFALKNLIMDNMSRIFVARDTGILGRIPGGSIAVGLYTQMFDREFAKTYSAMSGIRGGVASAAQRDLQNRQAGKVISMSPRTMKEWTEEAISLVSDPKRFVVEVAKSPLHAIELVVKAIEATETMGRLGQAKIVQGHLKRNGVSDADAAFGAMFEARDILDYDRRGFRTLAATRFMPFLNVGFQGIAHANEVLFGAPFRAALQSYKRGGYANLDGNERAMLAEAVKSWGMIAAAGAMTYSYAMYMSDDPVYQAQSEYMRRRYYIFPAGQDSSGRQKIITMPKPFDAPGAILSAIEGFVYSQRREDGKTWERVAKALEDVAIPRQFTGIQEFLGANPVLKTGTEAVLGVKMGFDGGPNFPIVPQTLKSHPPDQQYQATTSWFAKTLGEKMGWSPMLVDHVMNGLGGTTVRDANFTLTAAVGENPNITMKDAMNRTFFGALYRDAPGGGQFRSDLMRLMATDNGKYSQLAKGYQVSREIGDTDEAERIYSNANETAKTLMTMRGSGRFRPADRQLHPLERTYSMGQILGKVARDLSNQELEILNGARRKTKKGEERNIIEIDPAQARAITNNLQSLMAEETRNGLAVAGEPGYQHYSIIDTKGRYEAIAKANPDVAKELQARMKAAGILPIDHVQRRWPEVKRRLLQDRNSARLSDLRLSP